MNWIDQDVPIENADKLAARREYPFVTAIQAGVSEAFAQLYATYSHRLYRTIIAITNNPEDAQDALQETFLRAHLRGHAFEGRSSVYTWLSRIAINSTLMIHRKRRTRPEVLFHPQLDDRCETILLELRDPAPNPEEAYDFRQRQIKTLRAIRRLDPKLQTPLRMVMRREWSVKEISHALNISESAVKSRLHRACQRLSTIRTDQRRFATPRQSLAPRASGDSVLPVLNQGHASKT